MNQYTEKQPIPKYRMGEQVIVSDAIVYITKVFSGIKKYDTKTSTQTLEWLYRGIFVMPQYREANEDDMAYNFSEDDILGVMPSRLLLNKTHAEDGFGNRIWRKFIPELYADGTDNTHLNPITHE